MMNTNKKLVVLTGAGISAESGISTFRDSNGLWENHRVEDVASPQGFERNPELVLEFYNQRRRQLLTVQPNEAHKILAELEDFFEVTIITQNVDNLHERAGSTNVIHLHGELLKATPLNSDSGIVDWKKDLNIGDLDENGIQLRPHIVWFGEMVPEMYKAENVAAKADIFLIVGTSLQVYPAAELINSVPRNCEIFVIDPYLTNNFSGNVTLLQTSATEGMKTLKEKLLQNKT